MDVVLNLGSQLNLPVIDLWNGCEGSTDNRKSCLFDGLHLNSKGNRILFELFKKIIESSMPQWIPANLPSDFPHWTELKF